MKLRILRRWFGSARCEFRLTVRRRGLWLAYALLIAFYGISIFAALDRDFAAGTAGPVTRAAAEIMYVLNLFMPLIAGLSAADRIVRDRRLGVRELQRGTALGPGAYLSSKWAGVLAGTAAPMVGFLLALGLGLALTGRAPFSLVPALAVAWTVMSLPAFLFVTAFSLACPLILPLRVYQVLFTGYWFWGNYLNPRAFPTLNGTLLTPSGIYALHGFFGGSVGGSLSPVHSAGEAVLNVAVIVASAAAAMLAARWVLRRQELDA